MLLRSQDKISQSLGVDEGTFLESFSVVRHEYKWGQPSFARYLSRIKKINCIRSSMGRSLARE